MNKQIITPSQTDWLWLAECLDLRPTKRRNRDIIEYAETTIIPTGKYKGSRMKLSRSPYLIEPLRCMSPRSPYQDVRLMFPAQTGKSTVGELCVMYYICEMPSEILAISSNAAAIRKWVERRIEPRALAAGVQFRAQTENKISRRSGDTTYSKEFDGGNLDMASALSAAQLASETKKFVFADEPDRWRLTLGEEGNTWKIMYARTQAWGDQRKILACSTPTTEDESLIYVLYLEGDQREYYVPCPFCGTIQKLQLSYGRQHGLHWENKAGRILKKTLVYVCESTTCAKEIRESKKPSMLINGQWKKGAISKNEYIASFHINGLYSNFLTWYEIAQEYEDALENPKNMQTFNNLKMGRAHRETGTRPEAQKVKENRGTYRSGIVPDGVLYLVGGIDVQRGSEIFNDMSDEEFETYISKNEVHPRRMPRLEMEILGVGAAYRYYSICYKVFIGKTDDPYGGAWKKLNEWAEETGLRFSRNDDITFPTNLIFIDSSDGERYDVVYRFTERWENTYPCKGERSIIRRKNDKPDEITEGNFKRYEASVQKNESIILYRISTNYYKRQLYNFLKIQRQDFDPQKPGYCTFPRDYTDHYFDMLTAEELKRDGSFVSHNRANEALDIRVYAMCAGDAWLDSEVNRLKLAVKQNCKQKKMNEAQAMIELKKVNHKSVIPLMEKNIEKLKKKKKKV